MDYQEYRQMADNERSHWWYLALHEWVVKLMGSIPGVQKATILDAGCGTGEFLRVASSKWPDARLFGFDANTDALAFAIQKSNQPLVCASVNQLPIDSSSVDIVVSLDVLYHRNVSEAPAIRELFRCLKPGGHLLVHVPAYNWLYSYHDVHVHTRTRYTKKRLQKALTRAGFSKLLCGYRVSLLLPAIALKRLLVTKDHSDVKSMAKPLNLLFYKIVNFETRLQRTGLFLPFGSSVWALAKKNGQ